MLGMTNSRALDLYSANSLLVVLAMRAYVRKGFVGALMPCPYIRQDWLPPVGAAAQALFEQGRKIGELAKQIHPGGLEVAWNDDIPETVRQSVALLKRGKPRSATYAGVTKNEKRRILRDLEAYCGLDTLGMHHIVRALGRL